MKRAVFTFVCILETMLAASNAFADYYNLDTSINADLAVSTLANHKLLNTFGDVKVYVYYSSLSKSAEYPNNQLDFNLVFSNNGKLIVYKPNFSGYIISAGIIDALSSAEYLCISIRSERNPGVATNGYNAFIDTYFILTKGKVFYLSEFFISSDGFNWTLKSTNEVKLVASDLFIIHTYQGSGDGLYNMGVTAINYSKTLMDPSNPVIYQSIVTVSDYHGGERYIVTEDRVNFRDNPSIISNRLALLIKGEVLYSYSKPSIFDFVNNEYGFWTCFKNKDGLIGWVWSKLVKKDA